MLIITGRALLRQCVLGSLISLSFLGQSWALDRQVLIDELYKSSSLKEQVDQLPALFQASFAAEKQKIANSGEMTDEEWDGLAESFQSAFSSDEMEKSIIAAMQEKISDEHLLTNIEELEKPYAQQVSELGAEAASPEGSAKIQACIADIANVPLSDERVAMIEELDKVSGVSEMTLEIYRNLLAAMMTTFNLSQPRQEQFTIAEISDVVDAQINELQPQIVSSTIFGYVCLYQPVSDEDLRKSINFVGSPAGSSFVSSTFAGMNDAFSKAGIKWGHSTARLIDQLQKEDRL